MRTQAEEEEDLSRLAVVIMELEAKHRLYARETERVRMLANQRRREWTERVDKLGGVE